MPSPEAPKKRGRPANPKTQTTAEAVQKAASRKAVRTRVVSISDFAALTGYDRNTVSGWIKRGCPVEGKGDKGAILLDVREVMNWREERAREDERAKYDDAPGDEDDDARLKRKLQTIIVQNQQVALATKTAALVRWIDVQGVFAETLNAVRQSIINIPVRQEREVQGWPKEMREALKESTTDICRTALKQAQQQLEKGLSEMAKGRLLQIGDAAIEDEDDDEVVQQALRDAFDD